MRVADDRLEVVLPRPFRPRHRSFWTPRRRIRWCPTPRAIIQRWTSLKLCPRLTRPPRLRHRLPQQPRPRMECIPTPRCKKPRSASPRLHPRALWPPRPRIGYVPTTTYKNYGAHHLDSLIGQYLWPKWAIHLHQEITFQISTFVGQPQRLFRDAISGN